MSASGRSKWSTTTHGVREALTRDVVESRARNVWRFRELLPITGEPRTGFHSGYTPLVRADRLAAHARAPGAVHQGRLGQPSDALVQGPRRLDGGNPRGRARVHRVRLRVDRQSRQQRVSTRRRALVSSATSSFPYDLELGKVLGSAVFRPHVIGVRGNYDDVNRLCTQIADKSRLGIREHQPAQLLRRRSEDDRLRSRRAARLAVSRTTSSRRSPAARCCRASPAASASCARSASSTASCRESTRRRPPVVRRSSARSKRGWSSRSR